MGVSQSRPELQNSGARPHSAPMIIKNYILKKLPYFSDHKVHLKSFNFLKKS